MRQVWTLVHAHWAAACFTAALQCSVLLTLPSASGCRSAAIITAPRLRLSHRLQAWLAFRKLYCFTTLYQLPRLTPNRFRSGRGCGPCDVIFLNSLRTKGNNSYRLICERHKRYSPTGRRNHGRPLKRLLDTWDRNGSTSGPTPWQIYDDDDDDDNNKLFQWLYQILTVTEHITHEVKKILNIVRKFCIIVYTFVEQLIVTQPGNNFKESNGALVKGRLWDPFLESL
jgi:hypothetical protein